jgi:hypothetical protein
MKELAQAARLLSILNVYVLNPYSDSRQHNNYTTTTTGGGGGPGST